MLFTRSGQQFTGTVETNDKGRPFHTVTIKCDRCHVINGQRLWIMGMNNGQPYSHTGFDCWTCSNTGVRGARQERLYTELELARVNKAAATRSATKAEAARVAAEQANAARAARLEAFRAEHAEYIAKLESLDGEFWVGFLDGFLSRQIPPSARQIELVDGEIAKRAKNGTSAFLGEIGAKIELTLTVERIINIGSHWMPCWLTLCRDSAGNVVIYKGNSALMLDTAEQFRVSATVAEHKMFNGVAQTRIQRPKLI